MRSVIVLSLLTWGLIEAGRFVSDGFSWGLAVGCAYASLIAYVVARRATPTTEDKGREE